MTQTAAETSDAVTKAVTETSEAVTQTAAETSDAVAKAVTETSDAVTQTTAETSESVTHAVTETSESVTQAVTKSSESVTQTAADSVTVTESSAATKTSAETATKSSVQTSGSFTKASESVTQTAAETSGSVTQTGAETSGAVAIEPIDVVPHLPSIETTRSPTGVPAGVQGSLPVRTIAASGAGRPGFLDPGAHLGTPTQGGIFWFEQDEGSVPRPHGEQGSQPGELPQGATGSLNAGSPGGDSHNVSGLLGEASALLALLLLGLLPLCLLAARSLIFAPLVAPG